MDRELFNPAQRDLTWRRAHGWRDDELVVLFFGRLVLEKGVSDYVTIVQRLATGIAVRPLVVGAGPAAGRSKRSATRC